MVKWINVPQTGWADPPENLDDLRGPSTGVHKLPPPVCGPTAWREYDLGESRTDRMAWCGTVMAFGGPRDVIEYLNLEVLTDVFQDLDIPAAVSEQWRDAHPGDLGG